MKRVIRVSQGLPGCLLLLMLLVAGCSSSDDDGSVRDADSDGVADTLDNCPAISNADQADTDFDGIGDVCESCQPVSLIDIWPGAPSSDPIGLTVFDDRLYFQANDGVHGEELWVHAPDTGAALVLDIVPGSGGSVPYILADMDGTLYLSANHAVYGRELWAFEPTDPNAQATLVADIHAGRGSSNPESAVVLDGRLYFVANDGIRGPAIWVYDPAAGVTPVTDFRHGTDTYYNELTLVGEVIYFRIYDDGISGLWFLQTADGSIERVDIQTNASQGLYPQWFTALDGTLYFTANDGVHGEELWGHDPVTGPILVADINPGSDGSNPSTLTEMQGHLYFRADHPSSGRELWEYVPGSGARLVDDIWPGTGSGFRGWYLLELGNMLYFIADDGVQGVRIWRHDPMSDATAVVANSPNPESTLMVFDGRLYLTVEVANGYTLWSYDPVAGFSLLTDRFSDSTPRYSPSWRVGVDEHLYFGMNDGVHGNELWVHDASCD